MCLGVYIFKRISLRFNLLTLDPTISTPPRHIYSCGVTLNCWAFQITHNYTPVTYSCWCEVIVSKNNTSIRCYCNFTEPGSRSSVGMSGKCISIWTDAVVSVFASNPSFIMINCIQPQSQSNMSNLCNGYRSHCVSVQPDRARVISEVHGKKKKKNRKRKRKTNSIGIHKFLFNSLSLNIRIGADPLTNKLILHYKN